MRYGILGPVEISDGARLVPAGGPRQVALLAFLLVNANRAVSTEQLLEALWSEPYSASANKRLQVSIARLRKTLDATEPHARSRLRTVAGGYRLEVSAAESDADLFQTRFDEGQHALEREDLERSATVLGEALDLWRGPPLADVAYEDWAQPEIRRLEELRLAALEARAEAALRLGRHAELTSQLGALVANNPTRERLTAQLMIALYRCGRQAEALDAYGRTRKYLAAELGLEPGPALKALQAQILEHSPALEAAVAAAPVVPSVAARDERLDRAPAQPAAPAPPPPGTRRHVAVLAARADLEDPEVLHALLERCQTAIEEHGGTVQRYLGDSLVGIFGLDQAHGDDHLRAARAAVQLRDALSQLRLGVDAGEVFLATRPGGTSVATGAAITIASRLAERAAPGEILLGERLRYAMSSEAHVDAESGRLLELRREQPALLRTPSTPFVGRDVQLDWLRAELERVRQAGECRLVTIVGPPGIGKSRLAGEFLAAATRDGTMVLAGRCLSYGEGTTYLALADIVGALGSDPHRRLEELLADDEQALRGILGAAGLSDEPAQADEVAWSVRLLLERLARERPVVVTVEDVHWAAPALVDVIDHVAALSSGSPILLVCLARPELLESWPQWAAPQPNRSLLVLEGLAAEDAYELAARLGAGGHAGRIAERADGNPLFVEQLVAVDDGRARGELPASIQSVLAARLDRLEVPERALLEQAAVEGRTFHARALTAHVSQGERRSILAQLVALTRKGLITPDRPALQGEQAFRFAHALIREAAYARAPKLSRARMHAALAAWLQERPGAADEVIGYHLEQSCVLAEELGHSGARERALAAQAATRLQAASRTALARGDPLAASALLERALVLVRHDERACGGLLPALGAALFEAGRAADAASVLDEAVALAREPSALARALVERELLRCETETGAAGEPPQRIASTALHVLEQAGDDLGQSRAWSLRAQLAWSAGQVRDADDAWCEAARCAQQAGDERERVAIVGWRATAAVLGPTAADAAIERCEAFRALVHASPVAVALTIHPLASLHAMKGEFERAERYLREGKEILGELGGLGSDVSHHEALAMLLAGRPELAEAPLRRTAAMLSAADSRALLATTTAMLAQAVYAQGRLEEAAQLCRSTAAFAAEDDMVTQVIWRGVEAKILAAQGRQSEADALARQAVALAAPTDLLSHHGDALLDLGEVLAAGGRHEQSRRAIRGGLSLYEQKGNTVAARRARRLLVDTNAGARHADRNPEVRNQFHLDPPGRAEAVDPRSDR